VLREADGEVLAAMIGYPLPDIADPARFDDLPEMFVALQELEDLVPGTWYINVLAALESARGKGLGQALLAVAEDLARASSCSGMSLIIDDSNAGARRLYERSGYAEVAQRPMIKENWRSDGANWVLLQKRL
jgi:ribosomal protein S18 acetylase RimI-like enzyme